MSKPKKRNVLKHGANAAAVMLWSEKSEDYEALRAELYLEFTPSGGTEEHLVQTLLDLLWRKRRLDCCEQIKMQKQLNQIRRKNFDSHTIENLRSFSETFDQAGSVEEVEAFLDTLSPHYADMIRLYCPPAGEDPKTWGPRIAKTLSTWVVPTRNEEADEFLAMVNVDEFDIALSRSERLAAMIDRTIKRLLQLKTMKQMCNRLDPKMLTVRATKQTLPEESPAASPPIE